MAKFYRKAFVEKREVSLLGSPVTLHLRVPQAGEMIELTAVFARIAAEGDGLDWTPFRKREIDIICDVVCALLVDVEGVEDESGPLDFASLSDAERRRLVGEIDLGDLIALQAIIPTIGRLSPEQKKSSTTQSQSRSGKSVPARPVKRK